jgi:hypothetical protein
MFPLAVDGSNRGVRGRVPGKFGVPVLPGAAARHAGTGVVAHAAVQREVSVARGYSRRQQKRQKKKYRGFQAS